MPVNVEPMWPTAVFVGLIHTLEARAAVKQARKQKLAERVEG
jgi:hypothetical protein